MKNLILSELLRFRGLAVALAIGFLLLLRLSTSYLPLFAQDAMKTAVMVLLCFFGGLALGLYQFGSYKKISQWTTLIHRPLAPGKIYLALAAAGGILIFGVLVLPLVVITLYTDLLSSQSVDARHYLLGPFIFGMASFFYLAGAFIMLCRSKAAFLVLGLAVFFLTREAVGAWIFVPLVLILLWLAVLGHAAFKPDLTTHLKKPWAVAASTLAIGYSLFWVLAFGVHMVYSMGTIFKEHGITGLATFAWNDYFPPGTVDHVEYLGEKDALSHALDPEAQATAGAPGADLRKIRHLHDQIALAEVVEVWGPRLSRFPTRHQLLFNDSRQDLSDPASESHWLYSHDEMLFQGIHQRTGRAIGWLGLHGFFDGPAKAVPKEDRFTDIPLVIRNRYLLTPDKFYEVDFERRAVDLRYTLPAGERFTVPLVPADTFLVAQSDRALYFFEPRELERPTVTVHPVASVPLPDEVTNISRLQISELIDSYLVSFLLGNHSTRDRHRTEQVVMEASFDGGSEVVARRSLSQGTPIWLRHRGFWISPLFQTAHDLVWAAIGPYREEKVTPAEAFGQPAPQPMLLLAFLVALGSAVATAGLARHRGLAKQTQLAWAVGALVLGLPGFLAFLFLTSRDEAAGLRSMSAVANKQPIGSLVGQAGWNV